MRLRLHANPPRSRRRVVLAALLAATLIGGTVHVGTANAAPVPILDSFEQPQTWTVSTTGSGRGGIIATGVARTGRYHAFLVGDTSNASGTLSKRFTIDPVGPRRPCYAEIWIGVTYPDKIYFLTVYTLDRKVLTYSSGWVPGPPGQPWTRYSFGSFPWTAEVIVEVQTFGFGLMSLDDFAITCVQDPR